MMDMYHLKHSRLTQAKVQKDEPCFEETNVKYDAGCQAVLAGQGAPAPQMTPASVLDIVFRRPGMVGEANYAESTHT